MVSLGHTFELSMVNIYVSKIQTNPKTFIQYLLSARHLLCKANMDGDDEL